jgi:hypothetical protein
VAEHHPWSQYCGFWVKKRLPVQSWASGEFGFWLFLTPTITSIFNACLQAREFAVCAGPRQFDLDVRRDASSSTDISFFWFP